MGFLLTENIDDDTFEYEGKEYSVNMAFDNILLLFEMFDDADLEEFEKPIVALQMLINEELPEFNTYEDAMLLFMRLMKEFLGVDLEPKPKGSEKENTETLDTEEEESSSKIYDYAKDAEIIFASFYSVYKIDLFDMQGKLHWKKFNALLAHLNDDSKFKQVIGYRTMKVPTMKEASKDYIKHVRKMKEVYSLDDAPSENKINKVFDNLSKTFKK